MGDVTDGDYTIKFCINCVYHDRSICKHNSAIKEINLVNGGAKYIHAALNRDDSLGGECGKEAKFFEPKVVKWYQFWRK